MTRLVTAIDGISAICGRIGEIIIGICGLGILISMLFAIVPRSFLGFSYAWPEEVSRYLMIWVAFVGASVALKRSELVSFEFFVSLCRGKSKYMANLTARLITLYFLVIFIQVGTQMLPSYLKSKASGVPITLFWPALGLFVGGIFMLVHTVDGGIHDICGLMGKEKE